MPYFSIVIPSILNHAHTSAACQVKIAKTGTGSDLVGMLVLLIWYGIIAYFVLKSGFFSDSDPNYAVVEEVVVIVAVVALEETAGYCRYGSALPIATSTPWIMLQGCGGQPGM